ncbi:MAG: glycerol-3-phosphate acyltransferase [Anaerolineales bacterium]
MDLSLLLALLLSYLIGSIPFSQVVAYLAKGVDLRKVGSRNVGGNNLIQNVGAGWGVLGGGLDLLKGTAAMWLAQSLGNTAPLLFAAGLAVVAGHNWSIFLGLRGGKGLATGAGAIALLAPLEAVACMSIWGLLNWRTGNGTTASFGAFGTLGIFFLLEGRPLEFFLLGVGVVGLVYLASARDLAEEARAGGDWTQVLASHKTPDKKRGRAKTH